MKQCNRMEPIELLLRAATGGTLKTATSRQRYEALCAELMAEIAPVWEETEEKQQHQKRAYYISAEFLMGRAIYNNLFALRALEDVKQEWKEAGFRPEEWEQEEDAALGNGGLGRLAACFLDSAATLHLPLDGYGIRYRFGLFRQSIGNGIQKEEPDDWTRAGDPWSVRCEEDSVTIYFAGQTVRAVPYDMPILGFGGKCVNTLRLWQSEPICPLDLNAFNDQNYAEAFREQEQAQRISQVLYPNDTTDDGKILRLKQEYFLVSASLQDLMKRYKAVHGKDFASLGDWIAVQLNDTHPVLAIPELVRILLMEDVEWDDAVQITRKVFSYTNHTVMAEAMEKWNVELFTSVLPHIYQIICSLDDTLKKELTEKNLAPQRFGEYALIDGGEVHTARLASYMSHRINGVAKIHTEILRESVLAPWATLYPERIINETNGITPRRWIGLCNPQLSALITRLLGDDGWLTDLSRLGELKQYANDDNIIREFLQIKQQKKEELCAFMQQKERATLDASSMFDIQVKRFHEYKRQTMNALGLLMIYFRLKDHKLEHFQPMTVLFGGKAASGYRRAKAAIKLIREIAVLINTDPEMQGKLKVVFAIDYNVSYAEKIIPAADVSEQISTAGTEASGTSNMKFMANGAVTLGTMDGANIEIVEQAGEENNYIFGMRAKEVQKLKGSYDPKALCAQDEEIRRVLDALVDGTLEDSGGMLRELHDSLLEPTYNDADHYMVLADLKPYVEARLRANRDYDDKLSFGRKCWNNLSSCGIFSSDRTVLGYAKDIWRIEPLF